MKQLLDMADDRRSGMVRTVVEKITQVTLQARQSLREEDFADGVDDDNFPEDDETKTALAQVLENAAFLGDVLLRFPDEVGAIFGAKPDWKAHFVWCLDFMARTRLADEATERMMKLVRQELRLVERDESYVNPYRVQRKRQKRFEEPPPKKKKERKKIKKGPRMSRVDL